MKSNKNKPDESANDMRTEEGASNRSQAQDASNNTTNISAAEQDGIRESVRRDVEKTTGMPTGSIHGHEGNITAIPDFDEADDESPE